MEAPEMRGDVPLRGHVPPPEIEAIAANVRLDDEAAEAPHFPAPSGDAPIPAAAPAEIPAEVDATFADATHWTARLLAAPGPTARLTDDARRLGVGLGLAAIYGLASGARQGGLAFATGAALVPAALLGAAAFGLPALYIALGMVDAPLAPRRLFTAASRAIASAGLVLAGLAPVGALYVVSSGDRDGAAIATALGLLVGALAGLRALWRGVVAEVAASGEAVKVVTIASLAGFALFAAAVGCRVWTHLPIFAAGVR